MKTIGYSARAAVCAATLAALTLVSCITDGLPTSGPYVSFTAGIEGASMPPAATRTTDGGNEWVAGDGVGIYMLSADGTIPAGVLPNMANKRYNVTDAATGALSPDASASPVIEYPSSGAPVDFVAYYPHSDEADNRVNGNGIFTATLTDQSDPARIDVLTARKGGMTSGPVTLMFGHALSKITLNIRLADGVTGITNAEVADIADVKLYSTPGSARVNVATGAVADGPNAAIPMLKAESAANDYDATFSAIVAPTSAGNGGGRYLTIVFNGKTIVWAIPATDIFAAGENYVYWGEITETDFRVQQSSIVHWNDNDQGQVAEMIPAKIQGNRRITWDAATSRYALTTDPTNAGLLFKFGSVAGIFSGRAAVQTLPVADENVNIDTFDAPDDVAWNPKGTVIGSGATSWEAIPVYSGTTDYPNTVTPESGYHTIENVKAGKGDPCRLVGLDLAKIKSTAAASLTYADIDNGKWRLPTGAENQSFTGLVGDTFTSYTEHWTTLSGVNGGMFPNATTGDATTFLPAAGYRNLTTGQVDNQSTNGYYRSSTPSNTTHGKTLYFYATYFSPQSPGTYAYGNPVRCVRQ